ncbi:hypothetical protein FA95DRAFT_315963 [Auriscalpium vulgare]|uniref:Uncharacterized protein n=1 Tax=Auriscalpium vulgare TaxID=40419 RepID=A0ACB8S4B2_9AGAM|nr:hypothetical protein FA95DRAFT_315963 [Auriscalpium vulgare]
MAGPSHYPFHYRFRYRRILPTALGYQEEDILTWLAIAIVTDRSLCEAPAPSTAPQVAPTHTEAAPPIVRPRATLCSTTATWLPPVSHPNVSFPERVMQYARRTMTDMLTFKTVLKLVRSGLPETLHDPDAYEGDGMQLLRRTAVYNVRDAVDVVRLVAEERRALFESWYEWPKGKCAALPSEWLNGSHWAFCRESWKCEIRTTRYLDCTKLRWKPSNEYQVKITYSANVTVTTAQCSKQRLAAEGVAVSAAVGDPSKMIIPSVLKAAAHCQVAELDG